MRKLMCWLWMHNFVETREVVKVDWWDHGTFCGTSEVWANVEECRRCGKEIIHPLGRAPFPNKVY